MQRIIFFDGVCGLCNRFVDFVVKRDRQGAFRFASLQSQTAKSILQPQDLGLDTIILFEDGKTHRRSKAVLRVLFYLGGWWSILAVMCSVVPPFIRDFVYDRIAAHRYRIFGRLESCRLPNENEKNLFLN